VTGVSIIIENFWPSIFDLGQHFTNIWVKRCQWWPRCQSLFLCCCPSCDAIWTNRVQVFCV